MRSSRLSRFQEKKLKKKLYLFLGGTFAIILFVLFFGVKILINFSLFIDKLRDATQPSAQSQKVIINPPVLNPLPEATNSAVLSVSGSGEAGMKLTLFLNDREYRSLKIDKSGEFTIRDVIFREGENTLNAKLEDKNGNTSEESNKIFTYISKKNPNLEITSPEDGEEIEGDQDYLLVSGRTDPDNRVTVNDRIATITGDGSFSYRFKLSEGENKITIVATNPAGNKTTEERNVTYSK